MPARAMPFASGQSRTSRSAWNDCPADRTVLEDSLRVGGADSRHWQRPESQELILATHCLDIVLEQWIIHAYRMSFAGMRLSAAPPTTVFGAPGEAR